MKDYIEQASKTSIPGSYPTHLDRIDRTEFDRTVNGFAAASTAAERLKKQVFYGRDLPRGPTIIPATLNCPWDTEELHANLGIMGESNELVEANTRQEVLLEGGDLLWYMAKKFQKYGITFEEAMEANIQKLKERFPNKFDADVAKSLPSKIMDKVTNLLPIKDD